MPSTISINLDDPYYWSDATGEPVARRMTITCRGCGRTLAPFLSKRLHKTEQGRRWVGLDYQEHVAGYTIECHRCGIITYFEVSSE